MNRWPMLLCLLASATPACGRLGGNGHKTTEPRSVSAFTAIRLEGPLDADVKVGVPPSAAVTIDSNLQPQVDVRVEGDTLVVSTRRPLIYRGVGKVQIGAPALTALTASGSGNVEIDGSSGGDLGLTLRGSGNMRWSGGAARTLRAEIAGSGTISLSGTADALETAVSGSGDVRASALAATNARVRVSGSGDVAVTLRGGTLDAEISGSGDVHWSGEAKVARSSVSGSGRIARTGGGPSPEGPAEADDDDEP
jgi:hypothetical protein